jgi:hypothetical protein
MNYEWLKLHKQSLKNALFVFLGGPAALPVITLLHPDIQAGSILNMIILKYKLVSENFWLCVFPISQSYYDHYFLSFLILLFIPSLLYLFIGHASVIDRRNNFWRVLSFLSILFIMILFIDPAYYGVSILLLIFLSASMAPAAFRSMRNLKASSIKNSSSINISSVIEYFAGISLILIFLLLAIILMLLISLFFVGFVWKGAFSGNFLLIAINSVLIIPLLFVVFWAVASGFRASAYIVIVSLGVVFTNSYLIPWSQELVIWLRELEAP